MLRNSINTERLLDILHQEEILCNSIEKSYNDLLQTSKEIEKRFTIIEEENSLEPKEKGKAQKMRILIYKGNEWKTRYENQREINQQFNQQVNDLEEKLKDLKTKNRFVIKSTNNEQNEDINLNLNFEKDQLIELLLNLNWRIEQELKTYHKANEERKSIQQEIHETRIQVNEIKEKADIKNHNEISHSERANISN